MSRSAYSRRLWLKRVGIYVPTIFSAGVWGGVRLGNLEPEVGSWIKRVKLNAGSYTSLGVVANDVQMKMVKAAGLRSAILRWNTYTGNDLASFGTPLVNDHGATVDTLAGTASGWTFGDSTGLTGNGTDNHLGTSFLVDSDWTSDDDCTMGVYLRTKTATQDFIIGNINGSTHATYLNIAYNGTDNYASMHSVAAGGQYATGADSDGTGHYLCVRNASNSLVLYRNGTSQYSTATPAGTRNVTLPGLLVHSALVAGVVGQRSTRTYGGYQLCTGMSAAQALAFYNIIQRGQTILGRQV